MNKNFRDDEIWKELLYFLKNPPTAEEEAEYQRQQDAWVQDRLDYIFDNDLLKGGVQKIVGSPSTRTPYDEVQNNPNLNKEEKVAKIREISDSINKEIDKEHFWRQAKNYGGAALEIGAAALPMGIGGKVASEPIKISKPIIEQIGKKMLTKGVVEGAASGALSGLGRGMMEDKNPLSTAVQDSVVGAGTGAALGGFAKKILGNSKHIKELDDVLDKRKDWGVAFRKQSGDPAAAIDKLLEQKKGFVPKAFHKEGIEPVDFVWGKHNRAAKQGKKGKGYGIKHILERRNEDGVDGMQFLKELPDMLNEGKVGHKQGHTDRYYIQTGQKEAAIKDNFDGKKRNWMPSAYPMYEETPLQAGSGFRTRDLTNANKPTLPLSDLQRSNNILTNNHSGFNPSATQNNIQKPPSFGDWLEELKKKRWGR